MKRPLKVFLCHAEDSADVYALYLRLVKDGINAWLDQENLLPGMNREHEIKKAIRESDVVIVCHSKQFNNTGAQQREVRLALDTAQEQPDGEIFIIPARLEECKILESLIQWKSVDLFESDGYKNLLRALRQRAKGIRPPEKPAPADDLPRPTHPKSKPNPPKIACVFRVIIFIFVIFVVILNRGLIHELFLPTALTPTSTPTFTLTPTSTSTFTSTPHPTLTLTPIICSYQGTTDDQTITNLIQKEAEASNTKDMSVMQAIFSSFAVFHDYSRPKLVWLGPEARYKEDLFKTTDLKDVIHFDIMPVGNGIIDNKATYISGSMGSYSTNGGKTWVSFSNGSIVPFGPILATKYGSEHWVLEKDNLGCWRVIQFDFNAGHIPFPP